jgi:hypothetical protein
MRLVRSLPQCSHGGRSSVSIFRVKWLVILRQSPQRNS